MISPLAYINPSAKLGENVEVYPFAYIDEDVVIGDNCCIMPYASVMKGSIIGHNTRIYNGAIVGADPQDFRWKGCDSHCYIGDNVIIREQVIINRGISPEGGTYVDSNCCIMAESHIGHDSHIEAFCVLGNGVKIAGEVRVESGAILSSNVILNERAHVGKLAMVKGGCRISSNVPPYVIIAHNPATYYGVNALILEKHAHFTPEQIDDITKAYRHIYRSASSLYNALTRIETDIEQSEVRDEILNFIRTNNSRIVGNRFDD